MFGVLKNAGCAIEPGERQQWIGHVCGVCLALKKHHGHPSRIATNYDAALLSVLCDAQTAQPQAKRTSYCPLRNSFKTEVLADHNPGVQYAASIALMMAASRAKDHIRDNETGLRYIRSIATHVSNNWMRAAREATAALGFDVETIESQIHRQVEIEAQPDRDFFYYSRPTELAVGAAFGHTAVITNHPQNADALYRMGQMFGRIMYLLDSYRDYAADLAAYRFNALAASFTTEEWRRCAKRIFHQAYRELKECLHRLDLLQPALLHTLLIQQLKKRGYKTLLMCKRVSGSCHPANAESSVVGYQWDEREDEQQQPRRRPKKTPCFDCRLGDCDCCCEVCYHCDCCVDCCDGDCDCCDSCDACDACDACDCCDCGDACGSCDCCDACDCCDCLSGCGDC